MASNEEEKAFLDNVIQIRKKHDDANNPFKRPEGESIRIVDNEWPANPVLRDNHTDITEDMVPKVIWDYAHDCADLLGISVSAVAMPAIIGVAALIHDRIRIQPKRYDTSWTESARLWAAIIGDPSARKSPAMAKALAPMQAINKRMIEVYHRENDAYQAMQARAKKDKSIELPDKPVKHRLIVEDTTVEALGEVLKENPKGVLVVHDELSGWIGSFDSYASDSKGVSRDRGYWLQAYNGGPITVNRIVRGEVYIPNFSCSIIGGIQPEVIRTVAKGMGHDGLLQRFMLFTVTSTGEEKDRAPDADAAEAFSHMAEWISRLESNASGPVTLCDEAHAQRESVAKAAHWGSANTAYPMALRGHLGKWTGLYARLLLTFHIIECAKYRVYPNEMAVSEETAKQVANLMFDFIGPNAEAFYGSVFTSKLSENIARLAGWLLIKPAARVSTREIAQYNSFWRTLEPNERQQVVSALVDCGWIVAENEYSGRAMPAWWVVNPDIHDGRFESLKLAEENRRKKAVDTLSKIRKPSGDS